MFDLMPVLHPRGDHDGNIVVLKYNEQKTQPIASHNGQTQMQAAIIAQRLEDKV